MDTVLQGLDSFAAAFLDDVIIHSNSWSDHLSHLQQVFDNKECQVNSETAEMSIYNGKM